MDKTTDKKVKRERRTIADIRDTLDKEVSKRRESRELLLSDIAVFLCALIFVRESMFFGSHPLAAAFVAVLPTRVFIALAGAVIGAMTLGRSGIIYAMICLIIVFLRVIISGGERKGGAAYEKKLLFHENILLRMSTSVIGGFIAAVYEILLSGFDVGSVLFGLAMILIPPFFVFGLSGLFEGPISISMILGRGKRVFGTEHSEREGFEIIFFQISALLFIFIVSVSLADYSALGISASYLFSTAVTLFVAKRFGALRAAAVGFISTLGVSGAHSAAFMLAGLVAGAVFPFGAIYAIFSGAIALSALSAYIGGVVAFASTLPEYALGATLIYPFISKMPLERTPKEADKTEKSATDMVGTMALAYRNNAAKLNSEIVGTLRAAGRDLDEFFANPISKSEFCEMVHSIIKRYAPFYKKDENVDKIATKLCKNEQIEASDLEFIDLADGEASRISDEINRMRSSRVGMTSPLGEELRILAMALNEAELATSSDIRLNDTLTDTLSDVLVRQGFPDGVLRAFGERRIHVILSGRDEDGTLVTSKELHTALEEAADAKFGTPEYFRRDSMVLMECTSKRRYAVSAATSQLPGKPTEISGDVAHSFDTQRDMFYALICDGMGSGEVAYKAAKFSTALAEHTLSLGATRESAVYFLNSYLRRGREECSVAFDLFELDLLNKEAVFLKSGAAPSYIKRGTSIFRIKSQTAPIGLMSAVDSEKIRVGVEVGDYIIMMSDGITGAPEDSPWLLELLASRTPRSPKEFADAVLAGANARGVRSDDMTVTVLRIDAAV